MNGRMSFLVVTVPEGAQLSFPLAGGISRFLAWLLDVLTIGALTEAAGQLLSLTALFGSAWQRAVTVLAYFAISLGYPMFCEWRLNGQTVGKRLFRLRVMDIEARRLTLAQIVIRNLVRLVDMLPLAYLAGGTAATFSRYGQRWGDMAAGTVVVREEGIDSWQMPDLSNPFNSLAGSPHLLARLRYSASRELIQIATAAVLRRDQLSPQARLDLFGALRNRFAQLATFPDDVTEHLTSEQYVRNVLAALTRNS